MRATIARSLRLGQTARSVPSSTIGHISLARAFSSSSPALDYSPPRGWTPTPFVTETVVSRRPFNLVLLSSMLTYCTGRWLAHMYVAQSFLILVPRKHSTNVADVTARDRRYLFSTTEGTFSSSIALKPKLTVSRNESSASMAKSTRRCPRQSSHSSSSSKPITPRNP